MKEKILYGIAAGTSVGLAAWRTIFPWIGDDLKIINATKRVVRKQDDDNEKGVFLIDHFEESVKRHPDKVFLIFEGCFYTYRLVDEYANKVANVAKSSGWKFGDTIALLFGNSPQFVWTFLGCLKLGITVALINTSLHSKTLSHSVNSSGARALIVGEGNTLLQSVLEAQHELSDVKIYIQGHPKVDIPTEFILFDELMFQALPVPVDKSVRDHITQLDTCCYIYTSGTTGMPKPAYMPHFKITALISYMYILKIQPTDIPYIVLPLYHSAACVSLFGAIDQGCTVVLKRKFSAHEFWEDVERYNVTVFQYIGELCRYLLSRPPSSKDKQHKIRAIIGNGLRQDIWTNFQTRFNIPLIAEFFGATEGNTLMFQLSNKPGSCGRLSPLIRMLEPFPRRLVKYDYDTAEPLRDENGRCIEIKPGEVGIFLSGVNPEYKDLPIYKASKEASEKKIIRNAFVDGDMYFNYGDLLYLDKDYFLYFKDRIGDTFRWKGENVSTTEVANILTDIEFIHDANVYGVTVPDIDRTEQIGLQVDSVFVVYLPGQDGRAGMAAITLYDYTELTSEQLKTIYKHCENQLPRYAAPLFLRVLKEEVITGTFKQKKRGFVEEGFDPVVISDKLYFRDSLKETYVPLTTDLYPVILKSKL